LSVDELALAPKLFHVLTVDSDDDLLICSREALPLAAAVHTENALAHEAHQLLDSELSRDEHLNLLSLENIQPLKFVVKHVDRRLERFKIRHECVEHRIFVTKEHNLGTNQPKV